MRLDYSDLHAVSETLSELYAHTDSVTLPHCIVRLLHRLIPADSAVYNSFDFRTGEMQVVHDHGPDGDRYLSALNEHIQQHPLLAHVRTHWREGAARLSDVISHRELRDQPIYREFLHPLGIERQLGLLVEDRQHGVAAVGLQREGRDFSKRDKGMLTLLQPHILQAARNAADITRAGAQNRSSEQALQAARVGVIRLTAAFAIEWISNHAANWLAVYFPGEHERVADGALPVRLENWLRQKLAGETPALPGVAVHAAWQVISERGVLSIRWINGSNGGGDLVLSEQRGEAAPRELESLGLSRREAEVLHWITHGKTNEVIAIILSTSRRTVDKQVESILRKLGVESRVAAALRAERHRRLG